MLARVRIEGVAHCSLVVRCRLVSSTTTSSSSSSLVVSSRKRKKHFGPRSKTSTLGRFPTSPRLYYSLERLQKEISKPNVPVLTASRFLSARFFQPLRALVKVQRRWWTRNLPQRRRECDQTHEARCLALDHLPEKARAPRLALRL